MLDVIKYERQTVLLNQGTLCANCIKIIKIITILYGININVTYYLKMFIMAILCQLCLSMRMEHILLQNEKAAILVGKSFKPINMRVPRTDKICI